MVRGLVKKIASKSLSVAGKWQQHQLRRLNIHEYQGAELMANHGINVPPGIAVSSVEEIGKPIQDVFPKENEARQALQALRGIIRLQAVARGNLVRRQAVATLQSVRGIVKIQALVRGQRVRHSDIGREVHKSWSLGELDGICLGSCKNNGSKRAEKLLRTAFVCKTKRKYRIAPTSASSDKRRHPSMLLLEGRPRVVSPKVDRAEADVPTKAQIDAELAKMRSMTPDEAAAAAARAVTEAEIAIAEAEEATREAEAAEADAEAAQAFAEAAMKTLKGRSTPRVMIRT